jgi:hypothetical protein
MEDMEDIGILYGHLVYFVPIFCGHLAYFMVIWYILSRFGMLYQKKSDRPASNYDLVILTTNRGISIDS